jgi:ThiF family
MADLKFLHENLYHDISSITSKRIVILGCGAIGANLAISLARRGFQYFFLIDYDRISEHNFSTQPWNKQDLGQLKVATLSKMLYSMTGAIAYVSTKRIEETEEIEREIQRSPYIGGVDVFVDCFDNTAARAETVFLSALSNYPHNVIHVGMSSQNTGEVTWNENYAVPPDVKLDDPCNYPMSRTLVDLTVTAASESIMEFLATKKEQDYLVNANLLKIEKV